MTMDFQTTLNEIELNTQQLSYDNAKRVLVLYEETIIRIGDSCIKFNQLKYFKSFLKNATLDLNFSIKDNFRLYNAFLTNNPFIDSISTSSWEDIDFESYDIVFCIKYNEAIFLEYLHERYRHLSAENNFRLAVFSLSQSFLEPQENAVYIFPVSHKLVEYFKSLGQRPGELYVNESEQDWASQWLGSKGLKQHDNLFIICDSASNNEKLIKIAVYFDVLTFLLRKENSRVLIFDEHNIGKEEFYQACLNKEDMNKVIFSKGLTLREDLRLIASRHTKLIFGPCTGLLHCASSIYNNYVNQGMGLSKIPLMITYTGQYPPNQSANVWWQNSPLISCLLLKERSNKKQVILLNDLTEEEKNRNDSLPCSEYTAKMLIDFIDRRLSI